MSELDPEVTPPDEVQEETPEQDSNQDAQDQAEKRAAKKVSKRSTTKKTKDHASGDVSLSDLRMGVKDSDSVRRLQTALGTNVTGDYDRGTQRAVRSWQHRNGFDGGRGIRVDEHQARRLFGSGDYTII